MAESGVTRSGDLQAREEAVPAGPGQEHLPTGDAGPVAPLVDSEASLPPLPQVSPDGRFYWNGHQWVSTSEAPSSGDAQPSSGPRPGVQGQIGLSFSPVDSAPLIASGPASLPSAPQLSPDSRFYWNGNHWVPMPAQTPIIQVSQPVHAGTTVTVINQGGPGLFVRALYFVFIGSWVGFLASVVAGISIASIIGLPVGIAIINALPKIVTLKSTPANVIIQPGLVTVGAATKQIAWPIRAVYFVVFGLWASLLCMVLAYLCVISVIGLPLAFMLYSSIPAIATLRRS